MLGKMNAECPNCGEDSCTMLSADIDSCDYQCPECGYVFTKWDAEPELRNVSWEVFEENWEDFEDVDYPLVNDGDY